VEPQPVVAALGAHDVKCMAFGTVGAAHKFYFYAQAQPLGAEPGALFLVELVLDMGARAARATLKSAAVNALPAFAEHLKRLVQQTIEPRL